MHDRGEAETEPATLDRRRRFHVPLTRRRLADILGKDPSTLHRWEKSGAMPPFSRAPGRLPHMPASVCREWLLREFGIDLDEIDL